MPYSQDRALEMLREVAAVPVFGMGDFELGRGIVGGPLMQTSALGREAAKLGLRILKGEQIGDIVDPPAVPWSADLRFARNTTVEYREALLPVDSITQFREQTVWEQYRTEILGALAIVFLEAALITALLFERQARKRAAELAGKARTETGLYRENLAHLSRVHTVGEMSSAIAHEINQPLVAIKHYAVAARGRLTRNGNAVRSRYMNCWTR